MQHGTLSMYHGTLSMYHGTLLMYHGTSAVYHGTFSYGIVLQLDLLQSGLYGHSTDHIMILSEPFQSKKK